MEGDSVLYGTLCYSQQGGGAAGTEERSESGRFSGLHVVACVRILCRLASLSWRRQSARRCGNDSAVCDPVAAKDADEMNSYDPS